MRRCPKPVDEQLGERLVSRYDQILLGRDRSAQTDDQEDRRGWERWLTGHAYKLDEKRYEEWARLLRFSAAGAAVETSRPEQPLGEFTLTEAQLSLEGADREPQPPGDGVAQARPGDILQVALTWRADRQPEANYTVFLQVLNEAGQVVAQSDRWPGDGLHPTAAMSLGAAVTDRVALRLPDAPGRYRLIAGMYRGDVEGAPRLTGPAGDFIPLAEIVIQ
ncbi:MAG: hypothetical protein MUC34_20795 [Anaerolineae bacterium]|nr:hypothetical protein [Anaerolineae bacterium]